MKKIIIIILIFMLNIQLSCAEDTYVLIENDIQKCMKTENYTTAGMSNCVYKSIPKWEKEIKKYSMLINKKMSNSDRELFNENCKQWDKYKKIQSDLIYSFIYNKNGTIYQNIAAGEYMQIYKERAYFVRSLYEYIKNSDE